MEEWEQGTARRPTRGRITWRGAPQPLAPSTMRVPVELYRGGTSRGLVLATQVLAPFPQAVRDRILCTASTSAR